MTSLCLFSTVHWILRMGLTNPRLKSPMGYLRIKIEEKNSCLLENLRYLQTLFYEITIVYYLYKLINKFYVVKSMETILADVLKDCKPAIFSKAIVSD